MKLLTAFKEGKFLDIVYHKSLDYFRNNCKDKLYEEIIKLHNEGLIDVIEAFCQLKNDSDSKTDFFLTRYVFEKTLPKINAPVISVIQCVIYLYNEAGQDMAAGTIFDSFIDFCATNSVRPKEALSYIVDSDDQFADLLPSAIIAGTHLNLKHFLNETLLLTDHKSIIIRTRAVFTLGKIQYQSEPNQAEFALQRLETIVNEETDDQLLGNAIKSAFEIYKYNRSKEEPYSRLIKNALAKEVIIPFMRLRNYLRLTLMNCLMNG